MNTSLYREGGGGVHHPPPPPPRYKDVFIVIHQNKLSRIISNLEAAWGSTVGWTFLLNHSVLDQWVHNEARTGRRPRRRGGDGETKTRAARTDGRTDGLCGARAGEICAGYSTIRPSDPHPPPWSTDGEKWAKNPRRWISRDDDPVLLQCWANVADVGLTLKQHLVDVQN